MSPTPPESIEYQTPGTSGRPGWARRHVAAIVGLLFAFAGGAMAVWGNVHYIKFPDSLMDWVVQLSGGVTFGVIIFFMVWGHFQEKDPAE